MSSPLVLSPEQLKTAIPSVLGLGQAHFVSQCLHVFVKFGVADVIGDGRLALGDIVKALPEGVNQEFFGRALRVLACRDIVEESAGQDGDFVYNLAPAGALLQTKAPQPNLASGIAHLVGAPYWGALNLMPDYVAGKSTTTPFEEYNGMPVFDYYDAHPEHAEPFNDFMTFVSKSQMPSLLRAECWKELSGKTVVDVGGSLGTTMAAVAQKFPDLKCISFDLPKVVESAGEPPAGVTLVGGDMFDGSTIPKADAIFMKHILHDWGDSNAEKILKSCQQALPDKGRVYIQDSVMPGPGEMTAMSTSAAVLDINMMSFGGKERTRRQWDALAESACFQVVGVENPGGNCPVVTMEKL